MLSLISLAAIAVIIAGLVWGWSKRFLAVGALALTNIVVHLFKEFGAWGAYICGPNIAIRPAIHGELGLCTANIFDGRPLGFLQVMTSMFVHFDFWHLVGNMFILLVFALTFEELIGPRRLIIVYLVTGVIAAASQMAVDIGAPILLMGASGAVAGITGAFAGAYPHMVMRLPIPGPIIFFARMRVLTWAILFALVQLVMQFLSTYTRALGGVAYAAHLGGLAGGLGLGYFWLRRAVHAEGDQAPKYALDGLDKYAQDSRTKRALAEMRANHDEPEVFAIWAERFWAGARDPTSGTPVRINKRGEVVQTTPDRS